MIPTAYFAPFDAHGGLLVWLFGGGIGTNIGASLIWGFAAGFIGYFVARKLRAAFAALHARHDHLIERVEALHDKFDQQKETP